VWPCLTEALFYAVAYQLKQHCRKNDPLGEIVGAIRKHLQKLSAVNDAVAGPFSFASITQDGFRVLSDQAPCKNHRF